MSSYYFEKLLNINQKTTSQFVKKDLCALLFDYTLFEYWMSSLIDSSNMEVTVAA